jgi:hypothetical protein
MARWKHTLRIKEEWNACKEGAISVTELTQVIIKKLKDLSIENDYELEDILDEFQIFVDDDSQDKDEFDDIWERLYDWADQQIDLGFERFAKLCWIEII